MSSFAAIGTASQLVRSCDDLSRLVAFQRQQNPDWRVDPLLGVWIDPRLVDSVPAALGGDCGEELYVEESAGLAGVWSLCHVEPSGVDRAALLDALVETSAHAVPLGDAAMESAVFVPVFFASTPKAEVDEELKALARAHPGRVAGPLHQDPVTGFLSPPPSPVAATLPAAPASAPRPLSRVG